MLVLPTVDDVFAFERELCGEGAALGGTVLTFGALFGQIATAAGSPPGAVLSPTQRERCVAVAVEGLLSRLGPLRRSAARPGFAAAFTRLLDELQAAGVGPPQVEASAGTLEGSAYLTDIATLFAGYEAARERSGRLDAAGIAREAIGLLRDDPGPWTGRPVFLYGLDDLTPAQFDLVEALARETEVTIAVPFEPANEALAARGRLLEQLERRLDVVDDRDPRRRSGEHRERPALRARPRLRLPRPAARAVAGALRPDPAALRRNPRRGGSDRRRGLAPRPRRRGARRDRGRPPRPRPPRPRGRSGAGGERDRRRARGRGAGRDDLGRRCRHRAARDRLRQRPRRRPPPLPARPLRLLPRPGRLAGAGDPARPDRRRRHRAGPLAR